MQEMPVDSSSSQQNHPGATATTTSSRLPRLLPLRRIVEWDVVVLEHGFLGTHEDLTHLEEKLHLHRQSARLAKKRRRRATGGARDSELLMNLPLASTVEPAAAASPNRTSSGPLPQENHPSSLSSSPCARSHPSRPQPPSSAGGGRRTPATAAEEEEGGAQHASLAPPLPSHRAAATTKNRVESGAKTSSSSGRVGGSRDGPQRRGRRQDGNREVEVAVPPAEVHVERELVVLNHSGNDNRKCFDGIEASANRLVTHVMERVEHVLAAQRLRLRQDEERQLLQQEEWKRRYPGRHAESGERRSSAALRAAAARRSRRFLFRLHFHLVGYSLGGLVLRAALPQLMERFTLEYPAYTARQPDVVEEEDEKADPDATPLLFDDAPASKHRIRLHGGAILGFEYQVRWRHFFSLCSPHSGSRNYHPDISRTYCLANCLNRLCFLPQVVQEIMLKTHFMEEVLLKPSSLEAFRSVEEKIFVALTNDRTVWNYSSAFVLPPIERLLLQGWKPKPPVFNTSAVPPPPSESGAADRGSRNALDFSSFSLDRTPSPQSSSGAAAGSPSDTNGTQRSFFHLVEQTPRRTVPVRSSPLKPVSPTSQRQMFSPRSDDCGGQPWLLLDAAEQERWEANHAFFRALDVHPAINLSEMRRNGVMIAQEAPARGPGAQNLADPPTAATASSALPHHPVWITNDTWPEGVLPRERELAMSFLEGVGPVELHVVDLNRMLLSYVNECVASATPGSPPDPERIRRLLDITWRRSHQMILHRGGDEPEKTKTTSMKSENAPKPEEVASSPRGKRIAASPKKKKSFNPFGFVVDFVVERILSSVSSPHDPLFTGSSRQGGRPSCSQGGKSPSSQSFLDQDSDGTTPTPSITLRRPRRKHKGGGTVVLPSRTVTLQTEAPDSGADVSAVPVPCRHRSDAGERKFEEDVPAAARGEAVVLCGILTKGRSNSSSGMAELPSHTSTTTTTDRGEVGFPQSFFSTPHPPSTTTAVVPPQCTPSRWTAAGTPNGSRPLCRGPSSGYSSPNDLHAPSDSNVDVTFGRAEDEEEAARQELWDSKAQLVLQQLPSLASSSGLHSQRNLSLQCCSLGSTPREAVHRHRNDAAGEEGKAAVDDEAGDVDEVTCWPAHHDVDEEEIPHPNPFEDEFCPYYSSRSSTSGLGSSLLSAAASRAALSTPRAEGPLAGGKRHEEGVVRGQSVLHQYLGRYTQLQPSGSSTMASAHCPAGTTPTDEGGNPSSSPPSRHSVERRCSNSTSFSQEKILSSFTSLSHPPQCTAYNTSVHSTILVNGGGTGEVNPPPSEPHILLVSLEDLGMGGEGEEKSEEDVVIDAGGSTPPQPSPTLPSSLKEVATRSPDITPVMGSPIIGDAGSPPPQKSPPYPSPVVPPEELLLVPSPPSSLREPEAAAATHFSRLSSASFSSSMQMPVLVDQEHGGEGPLQSKEASHCTTVSPSVVVEPVLPLLGKEGKRYEPSHRHCRPPSLASNRSTASLFSTPPSPHSARGSVEKEELARAKPSGHDPVAGYLTHEIPAGPRRSHHRPHSPSHNSPNPFVKSVEDHFRHRLQLVPSPRSISSSFHQRSISFTSMRDVSHSSLGAVEGDVRAGNHDEGVIESLSCHSPQRKHDALLVARPVSPELLAKQQRAGEPPFQQEWESCPPPHEPVVFMSLSRLPAASDESSQPSSSSPLSNVERVVLPEPVPSEALPRLGHRTELHDEEFVERPTPLWGQPLTHHSDEVEDFNPLQPPSSEPLKGLVVHSLRFPDTKGSEKSARPSTAQEAVMPFFSSPRPGSGRLGKQSFS